MITTPDGLYYISVGQDGVVNCANLIETGATAWIPGHPDYTEANPLTAAFLARGYDLSDRPPSGDALAQLKAAKMAELNALCTDTIHSGFSSSALGLPHRYSSQAQDQTNLLGAERMAQLLGTIPYVCTDGEGVKTARLHTLAQIQQVMIDGGTRMRSLIDEFHELEAQVAAATTAAEVAAIAWTAT